MWTWQGKGRGFAKCPHYYIRLIWQKLIHFSFHRAAEYINLVHVKKSELPSATFHASARALAKLAAMMANEGESLDSEGKDIMNKSTWKSMHANEKRAFDAAMYSKFFIYIFLLHIILYIAFRAGRIPVQHFYITESSTRVRSL